MISEDSLSNYLDRLASPLPAPGAGCAAAITAAQGAALLSMVCNLTVNKRKYYAVKEEVIELRGLFDKKRKLLLNLAEADMLSFEGVVKSYKMPKLTEEEKTLRNEAIQAGLKKAVEIPLELIKETVEVIEPATRLAKICNQKIISDVHVALSLLKASIKSSRISIEYNLKQIKDKSFCREKQQQMVLLSTPLSVIT